MSVTHSPYSISSYYSVHMYMELVLHLLGGHMRVSILQIFKQQKPKRFHFNFMLYLLINLVFAGTLWPVSIDLSIANRYEYADYTFTLIPDSTIPIDSEIQIIFPSQYLYGLGIDLVLDSTCSHVCTITGYLVRFYMENEVVSNQTL